MGHPFMVPQRNVKIKTGVSSFFLWEFFFCLESPDIEKN